MSSETSSKDLKSALFDQAKNYFATRKASACCSYFLPHIKPDFNILDVGSGPGSITVDLAQLVPQGHITGFEITPASIDYARTLAASRGVSNVDFIQGDAQNLSTSFPDTKFDIVHAHMVIMHLADPVSVLKQMRALLKPGGLLAIRDTIRHIMYPIMEGPDSHQEAVEAIMRLRGGDPHGGLRNHAWVHEAGFAWEDIRFDVDTWGVAKEDKELFMKTVRGTFGMVAQAQATHSKRSPDELVKEWTDWWAMWEKSEEARFVSLDGWVLASL